jgi:trehalose 6-phosphate phosphatase
MEAAAAEAPRMTAHADPREVAARLLALAQPAPLLLCLDYDGTIRPNVGAAPHGTPAETIALLARLQRSASIVPAIVTGRAMDDVRSLVPLEGFGLAGEHGMEIDAAGLRAAFDPGAEVLAAVRTVTQRWLALADGTPGCAVQVKPRSASFHFKGVAEADAPGIESRACACGHGEQAAGLVTLTGGWRIVELRPAGGWTKGTATGLLAAHLRAHHGAGCAVAFAGDDLTDEDALRHMGGLRPSLGIRVAADPCVATAADVVLRDVAAVIAMLEALAEGAR